MLLILLILMLLLFGGLGFAIHWLWIAAVVFLIVAIVHGVTRN